MSNVRTKEFIQSKYTKSNWIHEEINPFLAKNHIHKVLDIKYRFDDESGATTALVIYDPSIKHGNIEYRTRELHATGHDWIDQKINDFIKHDVYIYKVIDVKFSFDPQYRTTNALVIYQVQMEYNYK